MNTRRNFIKKGTLAALLGTGALGLKANNHEEINEYFGYQTKTNNKDVLG